MPENINVEVLFFNARAVGVVAAELHRAGDDRGRPGLPRRHRDGRDQAGQDLDGRHDQRAAVHQRRRRHQDRHAHAASTSSASAAPSAGRPVGCAARETLEARARILRAVRAWFDEQGFLEVETPARVRSPGQEVHLDAVRRRRRALADHVARVPHEAAGRGGPAAHRPDRRSAGAPGSRGRTTAASSRWSSGTARTSRSRRSPTTARRCCAWLRAPPGRDRGGAAASRAPFARTTVRELCARHAGIDLTGDEDAPALRAKAAGAGVALGNAEAWDDIFYQVFLDRIEPRLAAGGPTFVFDWPAPLARARASEAGGSARGRALRALRRRPRAGQRVRRADRSDRAAPPLRGRGAHPRRARGKAVYPIDEALLAALPRMPPTAGIALGFDRLVMLALGIGDIAEVVSFGDERSS